jgi:hypothetical protein
MLTEFQLLFRQCFCRALDCGRMFFICSHCDRGQVYCGSDCRERSRRLQLRAANLRHQQSEDGQLDHRDRQRDYRRRQARAAHTPAQENVTDQGSNDHPACETVGAAPSDDSEPAAFDAGLMRLRPSQSDFRLNQPGIVCCGCGRSGLFINPFLE